MKDWQYGNDLEFLKGLENLYSDYNKYALSPFLQVKKNNIAKSLHEGSLRSLRYIDGTIVAMANFNVSKVSSDIVMHCDTKIATKQKGDATISKYVSLGGLDSRDNLKALIDTNGFKDSNLWLYLWTEDGFGELAEDNDFVYIGTKISTFGDLQSIWYRGEPRKFPEVHPADKLSIVDCGGDFSLVREIRKRCELMTTDYTNHYSNYNKRKSWSALSLRGYSYDPSFITKPSEMNDKWHEEHKTELFYLQDTPLYAEFPEIKELNESTFGNAEIHRVRLMKLKPGGGELSRHTDQVDFESGGSPGKIGRFHFPIKTSPFVTFSSWKLDGERIDMYMREGNVYFLDTRKPHMAVNNGTEERIHLVVDVCMTEDLSNKLLESENCNCECY